MLETCIVTTANAARILNTSIEESFFINSVVFIL